MSKNRSKPTGNRSHSVRKNLTQAISLRLASCIIAAATVTTTTQVRAEAAAPGVITGRVQNAANGMYLNNAKISIEGTNIETFTDAYGEFQLNDVPAGPLKLKVFYTGLDTKILSIELAAGEILSKEIRLTSQEAYGSEDAIKLDTYVVSKSREREASAIAVNEQRFANNIKTVISTDAFGDVAEGNIGEFLKYMPGATIDYVAADARSVGLNGLDPAYTTISMNGNRMANAGSGNASRTFEFESVTIGAASRIERNTLPTPEMSSEGLAGSINMVSKNAFESARPKLNISGYMGMNSDEFHFHKTGGIGGKQQYRALPNLSFDYINPVTKNFGFTLSGISTWQNVSQRRSQLGWTNSGAGASFANPFLQSYTLQDGPKTTTRESLSSRIDWKFAPGHVLSFSGNTNYYSTEFNNRNINWGTGTSTTVTPPAGGTGLLVPVWGPTFTNGVNGRGSLTQGTSFRNKRNSASGVDLNYKFKSRLWDSDLSANYSKARVWYKDLEDGHFEGLSATAYNPDVPANNNLRVSYSSNGTIYPRPTYITAQGTAGTVIDPLNLASYNITTATSRPVQSFDIVNGVNYKIKRELDFLPFYSSVKVGALYQKQTRDIKQQSLTYTYNGVGGSKNAAAFVDKNYLNHYNGYGFSNIQWVDPYAAYALWKADPSTFSQTIDQQVATFRFNMQNSQYIEEVSQAAFIQSESKLIDNKLNLVFGVRYENTKDDGLGMKVAGTPIKSTKTSGYTQAELDALKAATTERGGTASGKYDGYFPSLNANFAATENNTLRFGFAKTYGRPNFSNIIPLTRVNDTNASANDGLGNIDDYKVIVRNTSLKPWTATNFDFTAEHYMSRTGQLSVRLFTKEVKNFFVTVTRDLTQADIENYNLTIDPAAPMGPSGSPHMELQTEVNGPGTAKLKGYELVYSQSGIPIIPKAWGSIGFRGSYTRTNITVSDPAYRFFGAAPEVASGRLSYDKGPLNFAIAANYTGRRLTSITESTQFGVYVPPRTMIDLSTKYKLTKTLTFNASARNIMNVAGEHEERYNSLTPDYAQMTRMTTFGVMINIGISANF